MFEKNEKMRIKKSAFKSIKWLSVLAFFLLLVFTLNQIKKTSSLFKDEAIVEGITFSTGHWSEEEDEEEVESGDVVINEIMWMGSDVDEKDEWIELKNMTDSEIDISNWRIKGLAKGVGEKAHLQIPNGYSIEANGYFLILSKKWDKTAINLEEDLNKSEGMTNKANMDISDEGEKLELVDQSWRAIDVAWKDNEEWPAGEDGEEKRSMQRSLEPKDGQDSDNWFTCLDENCNKEKFWKESEGDNFGTPGEENLFNKN